MGRADGVLTRINAALRKVSPLDRTVYKRTVTRTGGDVLIGRPAAITYSDTLLSPQPLYQRLGRNVVGDRVPAQEVLANTKEQIANDYELLISPTAMALADLQNPDVLLVFKDAAGNEESFRITDREPVSMNGVILMFLTYVRSTKRPA